MEGALDRQEIYSLYFTSALEGAKIHYLNYQNNGHIRS